MDKYTVKLYSHAVRDLEEIYTYIEQELLEPEAASGMMDTIENAIYSLEFFPERGSYRKYGSYAGKKYRQLIVKNYSVIYKIDVENKNVIVVTVRNLLRDF
ncbi:MAG: type II toxin-antitoxin system RelE/ParE family toxin [Anaerolineaceae bacterium]|nr:type II toxin-antitoxin system RelE/ParE family toxin [Anaerolineaceae bacterium]